MAEVKLAEFAGRLTGEAVQKMRNAIAPNVPPSLAQQVHDWPGYQRLLRAWHYRLPSVSLRFEKHDLWVGLFWRVESHRYKIVRVIAIYEQWLHIYVGIVPLFPIHLTIKRFRTDPESYAQGDSDDG